MYIETAYLIVLFWVQKCRCSSAGGPQSLNLISILSVSHLEDVVWEYLFFVLISFNDSLCTASLPRQDYGPPEEQTKALSSSNGKFT